MRFLGMPPIKPYAYVLGKLCVVACWASLAARWFWPGIVWFRGPALDALGAVALAIGVLVLGAGLVGLGRSLTMGLPTEKTALETAGPYQHTRNPIYVGGLLICMAAVLWTANPIILLLMVVTATVHHRIVLAEEKFLAAEFGEGWREYASRVRRYL